MQEYKNKRVQWSETIIEGNKEIIFFLKVFLFKIIRASLCLIFALGHRRLIRKAKLSEYHCSPDLLNNDYD